MILAFNLVSVLLCAPLMVGCVRFFKARLQNRRGAPVYIPYLQLLSLLKKEETITRHSSWVFRVVPLVVFATALFLALGIPTVFAVVPESVGNVFVLAGVLALGSAFLVMGGMDTASTFGNMGSSREMTLATLIEPSVFVSVAALSLLTGATTLGAIAQVPVSMTTAGPILLVVLGLIYVVLLENARYPVDNPATHLELTMVHEAMLLEYSGPSLALLEYASAIKLAVLGTLPLALLLPWSVASSFENITISVMVFLFKIVVAALGIALIETAVVKMRFYRMQEYTGIAYLISVAGVIALLAL